MIQEESWTGLYHGLFLFSSPLLSYGFLSSPTIGAVGSVHEKVLLALLYSCTQGCVSVVVRVGWTSQNKFVVCDWCN